MKLHIGTKLVKSKPMNRIDYNKYRGWDLPSDENGEDEGYLVEYVDGGKPNHKGHEGYISWSPKEQFDNAYQDVTKGMTFGHATEMAKLGHKVARTGFNGCGMYAVIMDGFPEGVKANQETADKHGLALGEIIKIRPYWELKTAQNDIATWSPSGSDSLGNDWVIVE